MATPLNLVVLRVFAPVLLLAGALGFIVPESVALTSGATPYNLFHLAFGLVGVACARQLRLARVFNVGFGALDLYQALASLAGWWPKAAFEWKRADDVLHVVIGLGLVTVGLLADRAVLRPSER